MRIEINEFNELKDAMEKFCDFLLSVNVREQELFESKLVFSELVNNIFKHSSGKAFVESAVDGGFIKLLFCSNVCQDTPIKSECSEVYAETGRGLFLVDNLCFERRVLPNGDTEVLIKLDK